MLKEWRSINGQNATYRRLGEAFLDMGSSENAQKVFELSKVTSKLRPAILILIASLSKPKQQDDRSCLKFKSFSST